jgi:Ca2+-binding RTX toxin-like protein
MVAGWALGGPVRRAAGEKMTRLAQLGAAGLLVGVGLVGLAAPAGAVVGCSYDADIATLTLEKRDGVSIGRDAAGRFVVTDGLGNPVDCGPEATVQTVDSVVIGVNQTDNDNETVTLDLSNGGFVDDVTDPAAPRDIDLSVDLGELRADTLVIEGTDDDSGDFIRAIGNDLYLNRNDDVDVNARGVDSLTIAGNAGNDELDASAPANGAVVTALGAVPSNSGMTLVGGDGDDILTGGDGNDILVGNRGDDRLTGNGGNDWLDTGPGLGTLPDLVLDGGDGTDTADFAGMFVPVEANLGEGVASYGDGGSGLTGMENLRGTAFGDLLVGDDNANTIDCNGGDDETYGMGGKDRVRGGSGDDTLHGSGGSDSLDGGDGDDTLHGGDSGDGISGGSGGDTIHGGGSGSGTDGISGETGSDVIFGGTGNQVILAGDGADEVYGEAGRDVVDGQDGEDMVFGGPGSDTVRGGAGPDQVYSGTGSDSADGGDGDDEVYGDSGSDHVDGSAGDDVLFGGGDSDRLGGADGDDVLNAGDGSDLLNGHQGGDILRGAAGTDTVSFAGSRFGVTANLTDGAASGDGEDALTDIENLWGSHAADSLTGDHFRNQLRGGGGADLLVGGYGNDHESGDGGNDVFNQGRRPNGGDMLAGGAGRRDVVDYSARAHRVRFTRDNAHNDGERREHDNILQDIDRVRR